MQSLQQWLTQEVSVVFDALGFEARYAGVKSADRPDLADYQLNAALPLAKVHGKNPRTVAEEIIAVLDPRLEGVHLSIAGPGFINFRLSDAILTHRAHLMVVDGRLCMPLIDTPKTIIVDYGGPNVAKPMHVGHLRSSIIGEALKRLIAFQGHEVIADIHLGDWGTQMGMLIQGLKEIHGDIWTYFDATFDQNTCNESPSITLDDLEALYPQISARVKEDKDLADLCRFATHQLQQGHLGYKALWQHFVDVSVEDMKEHFSALNVSFDQWFGESRYQPYLQDMVDALLARGIAIPSDGAIILPVAEDQDKMDVPPLLLQKSDGGFLYGTTDLATIYERVNDFGADEIIYVVDGRQQLHFTQVFRAAHKAGINIDMHFVGFGTMNGADNKPFKTRSGGVMKLGDLIQLLRDEAMVRINDAGISQDFPPSEKQKISDNIAIAALKFADLQHDPKQNYQFSLDKFMRFEGKTGPYLLYAAVRIKSILRKGGRLQSGADLMPIEIDLNADERSLLLMLVRFPEIIDMAAAQYAPNILCAYIFELAQCFSRFYQSSPVLTINDIPTRESRLTICALTLNTLLLILDLLGIDVPERM